MEPELSSMSYTCEIFMPKIVLGMFKLCRPDNSGCGSGTLAERQGPQRYFKYFSPLNFSI